VQPTDQVLEIGFGPGLAIAELARRATRGHIYGIDHSEVMVRQASKRNAAAIRAQRVELAHMSVDRLPRFAESLDAIVAVNSVGFWPNPTEQLSKLRGLLRPGGRIALASQPRCPGATADTTARAGKELHDWLTQAGFTQARVENPRSQPAGRLRPRHQPGRRAALTTVRRAPPRRGASDNRLSTNASTQPISCGRAQPRGYPFGSRHRMCSSSCTRSPWTIGDSGRDAGERGAPGFEVRV
jgi:SAM-dependent methyltransferase